MENITIVIASSVILPVIVITAVGVWLRKQSLAHTRERAESEKLVTTMERIIKVKSDTIKKLVAVVLICLSVSCSNESDEPTVEKGCLTGIPKGGTERVFIRCCTHEEFLAGSNTNIGGTGGWSDYTSHQWDPVSSCDECQ